MVVMREAKEIQEKQCVREVWSGTRTITSGQLAAAEPMEEWIKLMN